jgi:hypothetical protein
MPDLDAVGAALQQHAAPPEDVQGPGAVLTRWALVAEWMAPDGVRWLSRLSPSTTSSWEANGMWHEALYGDWSDDG